MNNNQNNQPNNHSDDEYVEKESTSFTESAGNIYQSIKDHLRVDFRHQYTIRKWFFIFIIDVPLMALFPPIGVPWAILTAIFWRYAFWSFQGGFIDSFVRGIWVFGSIGDIIKRMLLQWFLMSCWITVISPISGIITWRKAVKHNKELFIHDERKERWTN